ncbi:aspartic peptidase domain-containing protein [Rhodocollybia butyracea]|uniref:Aspartic peptidase domain-containing protein n=1 Tax=Rhodocollybia butyracea TaxID=206335 RepID=A0A9P5UE38_9AGAR|nr:aspartic peptidase domain-containing protein [Rhodocollybia butyracea]
MKVHYIPLAFALAVTSNALKFPVRQLKRSSPLQKRATNFTSVSTNETLSTVSDLIYIADIALGGVVYPIQLDTGSSDLWVKGPSFPLPNTTQTTTAYNITYGIGWANGTVSYASVEFAGINITSQAYLDVSVANNPALSYGADGIAGLGFTSLSTIDALVNNSGSASGRSLLYNMFMQNPSDPNFIAFALQRSSDDDTDSDDVQGSFTIGEYDPDYTAVATKTAIPTWPTDAPDRWSVLLDAYMVGTGTYAPTTQVANVPSNRAVVVLDTGTSWSYAPTDICDIIYSGVSGAQFSSSLGQWILPCDAEIDMALQFGGQIYPLHPLDINIKNTADSSQCLGTFVPSSFDGANFDWLLGDNVLRALYSVYDFGDFDSNGEMINPFLKLLSLVDPDEASQDFVKARGGTARTGITYNQSNATAAATSVTSVDLSTEVAETLAKLGTYFPAILAVVALNALVILALAIVGTVLLCKKTKKSKRQRMLDSRIRTPIGRMSPMPMNARDSNATTEPHNYEPISMALTEDTMFVPPSPAFKRFPGGKGADRPSSLATLPSQRSFHKDSGGEDAIFNPPSPGFREFTDSRPRSMGMPSNNPYQPYVAADATEQGEGPMDQPFNPPHSPGFMPFPRRQRRSSATLAGPSSEYPSPKDSSELESHQSVQLQDEQFAPPRPKFQFETRNIDRPMSMGYHDVTPEPSLPKSKQQEKAHQETVQ